MDPIFFGMASIPSREHLLESVTDRLVSMADRVGICLNGYDHIPSFFMKYRPDAIRVILDPSNRLTDIAKFIWADTWNGYYFTVDDDILYPVNYTSAMIGSLKSRGDTAIVGVHGKAWPNHPGVSYREGIQYHFRHELTSERQCHMLGTGTVGFNTKVCKIGLDIFKGPRNADLWLARWANKKKVPMICVPRKANWLVALRDEGPTIWDTFANNTDEQKNRDKIIADGAPWPKL